jgi:Skp family chaperone for outer membrane proteins
MNRGLLVTLCLIVAGFSIWGATQSAGQVTPADTPTAPAARHAASPIAVLDLVRVFNECQQIKHLNEMIRKRTDEATQEASQRKKVIEDKQEQLTAFQPGTPDHDARRKDLMRLNIDANVWLKLTEQEVETQKFDWTRVIYEKSIKAAAELAQQRGHLAVVQKFDFKPEEIEANVQALRRMIQERTVIYNLPEIDITDDVIRKLDTEYEAAGGKKQLTPSSQPTR